MPVPATAQAIRAPATPVSCANRLGSEKTPAPTIEPTTIAVRVRSDSLAAGRGGASGWLMVSLVDAVIGQSGKASNMPDVLSRNEIACDRGSLAWSRERPPVGSVRVVPCGCPVCAWSVPSWC
ncbi:hypothetical protein SBADM41S_07479 [Streptomyces badius]